MNADADSRPCPIELAAKGEAQPCPEGECPFWLEACALTGVEHELAGRPDVAGLLLAVRRTLARARRETFPTEPAAGPA